MSPITTHVLDLSTGRPAQGVAVVLSIQVDGDLWEELARADTDPDGRARDLLESIPKTGSYRLRFQTYEYFEKTGVTSFYPWIDVHFLIVDALSHYHLPILLSPFGYSTYRGS